MLIVTDEHTAADIRQVADELAARRPEVQYEFVEGAWQRFVTTHHIAYNAEGGVGVEAMTTVTVLGTGVVFFADEAL